MKVGTDGVLLGAWANVHNASTVLDIGTGTGLIALMAAQRNLSAVIDAVEIDETACIQAKENFDNSKWKDRINLYCSSFQQFADNCTKHYDIIISNPPYFNNSLKPADKNRNTARHTDSLPYTELAKGVKRLLSEKGYFSLILPVNEANEFEDIALANTLYCSRKVFVKPNYEKEAIRILMEFTHNPVTRINEQVLCIETGVRHCYTDEFKELTKDFYL